MYTQLKGGRVISCIKRKPTEQGESIEEMIRRCTENNEPIEATAPMIYTEEADGVQPQFDIRADKFDIALDAIDKYNKSLVAKGQEPVKDESNNTDKPNAQGEDGNNE